MLRGVTGEIMRAIQKLSGQEYVDSYARKGDEDAGGRESSAESLDGGKGEEPGDAPQAGPE